MMKSRVQEAKNRHKNGYNCAQAVACTYCDLRGTDGKTDRLRSCRGCVADCARIVEDVLFPGQFEPYEARHAEEE